MKESSLADSLPTTLVGSYTRPSWLADAISEARSGNPKVTIDKLDFEKAMKEKDRLVRRLRKEKYQDILDQAKNVENIPELAQFI